jgi:hypothetical protein
VSTPACNHARSSRKQRKGQLRRHPAVLVVAVTALQLLLAQPHNGSVTSPLGGPSSRPTQIQIACGDQS